MNHKLPSFLIITFLITFFTSCSSDDDNIAIEPVPQCKIVKHNTSSDPRITFDVEFVYQNNRIIKIKNYGNILPVETGFTQFGVVSEDSIVYSKNNNVEKIINLKYKNSNGIFIYTVEGNYNTFFYKNNQSKPYKREYTSKDENGKITYKWIETIQYDSENRIIQTDGYSEARPEFRKVRTTYTYDSNGNLSQFSETETYSNGDTNEKLENFSNYDTNKNPFKNITVPLVVYRKLNYSNNNYRSYTSQTINNEGRITDSSIWQIDSFIYNENGYPLFAEYECN